MGTLGDTRKRGSKTGNWLHGSDLPAKVNSVKVKVGTVEEATDKLNCKFIVKFPEPIYDADAWTVNATNFDICMEKLGLTLEDDFSKLATKLIGKTLTLVKVKVNDPKKNRAVDSLQISEIK